MLRGVEVHDLPAVVGQDDENEQDSPRDSHGVLLPLVEPADQRRQEQSDGEGVEHGGRVDTDRISGH
jgi:hypothetical protein